MFEQALEAHLERWERKYEQMKKLSERWQMLFSGADPKSIVGQFPHPEWGDEIAQLEVVNSELLEALMKGKEVIDFLYPEPVPLTATFRHALNQIDK